MSASIDFWKTSGDVSLLSVFGWTGLTAYIAKRQTDTIVVHKARVDENGKLVPEETKPVSNAEINRELQILKRIFSDCCR